MFKLIYSRAVLSSSFVADNNVLDPPPNLQQKHSWNEGIKARGYIIYTPRVNILLHATR